MCHCWAYNLWSPPPLSASAPLIALPLAAAANSHKCHVRQFVICVKDAAANGNVAALESFYEVRRRKYGVGGKPTHG